MRIYTFLWFFLISCAFAQNENNTACRIYECDALPDNTCASVTQEKIIVNDDGCPEDQGCSLADLISDPNTVRNITCQLLSTITVQPPTRLLQDANTTTVIAEPIDSSTSTDLGNGTTIEVNSTATTANDTTVAVPVNATSTDVDGISIEVNNTAADVNATTIEVNTTVIDLNATSTDVDGISIEVNNTSADVNATTIEVNTTAITNQTEFKCPNRTDQKDLENGSYPKECTSEDDCKLEDGTKNACVCGADGKRYCRPDKNSDVFDDFWEMCEDDKMDSESNSEWEIYNEYYVFLESAPSCMEDIFKELITADAAESNASDESDFGMLLGLSGLIWMVLLS